MPETRNTAKRVAGAALLSENSVKSGNKRPADIIQAQDRTYCNKRAKKRAWTPVSSAQENVVVLPHGLGAVQQSANFNNNDRKPSPSSSVIKANRRKMALEELKKAAKPRGLPKETPENKYRLMPGATPFPDWPRPTPEECQTVYDILVKEYEAKQKARMEKEEQREEENEDKGTEMQPKKYVPLSFRPPAKIQPPSTTVAGCGEVPDLVDAMMRTLVSQSVTRDSANMVLGRITSRFGHLDSQGIGAGSIDWNAVRLAPPEDVIQTLHKGGLQNRKYEGIRGCLDMIYEENQVRRAAYLKERETGKDADVPGAAEMTAGQKEHQLNKIEAGVLTLDHIRAMSANDAMLALVKHPQVGVKTAACLLLFCLQMPSFAVDTHVYRMCKWLYWVPGTENENYVYMHCDIRVPDHLKYGLHQLFIEHGICPLEHLLDRYNKKKSKLKAVKTADIGKEGSESQEILEGSVETVVKETSLAMTHREEEGNGH
ncbi:HhH-GPD superfamily base excision DNA repair protein [Colletotrichum tofieldiae]|nr:HhH-GPD superfamily base excision DNA repair protein [Colletotrichum tofieldiae]GKT69474.1 HhH-GPD superfamily base excision DNA repair protein [Colletotrichum tofieldiae]